MALITDGNDSSYIAGTNTADVILAGGGRDRIYAGKGDDVISGGEGDDTITGMKGDDVINGDAGNDFYEGAQGADTFIYATTDGDNNDVLAGFRKSDQFDFENGVDLLEISLGIGVEISDLSLGDAGSRAGFADAVVISFSNGNSLTIATELVTDAAPSPLQGAATSSTSPDAFVANAGDFAINDVIGGDAAAIDGMGGNDLIVGGNSGQILNGGSGNDIIGGAGGDDTIIGGAGDDLMFGGSGGDTFVLEDGAGDDAIADFVLADGDMVQAEADDVSSTDDTGFGVRITFDSGNTVDVIGTDFDASDISSMYT